METEGAVDFVRILLERKKILVKIVTNPLYG
jgi:hypothetical protein